jgi:hypothetical protein
VSIEGTLAERYTAVCRDCAAAVINQALRCPKCNSRRLFRHAELHALTIGHVDCDSFYATIEKRDRPELTSRPVIVGGDGRGVVAACCYVARLAGVRSAMPMAQALERCPDAIVIPPNMQKYKETGMPRLWLSNRAPWVKFFFAKPTCAIAPAPAWRDRSRRNAERSRVAGVPRGSEFGMAVQATPTMRYRSSGKIATPSLLLSGGTATDVRPPFRRGHQSGRVPGSGLCRVQGCLRGRQGAAA